MSITLLLLLYNFTAASRGSRRSHVKGVDCERLELGHALVVVHEGGGVFGEERNQEVARVVGEKLDERRDMFGVIEERLPGGGVTPGSPTQLSRVRFVPKMGSTSASSALPLMATFSLPIAAITVCRNEVRFVAFRPTSIVRPE